jgi:hypothetical protein
MGYLPSDSEPKSLVAARSARLAGRVAESAGQSGDLVSGRGAGLAQQVGDVHADGLITDEQRAGYLGVGPAGD